MAEFSCLLSAVEEMENYDELFPGLSAWLVGVPLALPAVGTPHLSWLP